MRGPDKTIVRTERRLRRNATDAERKLWFALRDRRLGGFKFVRQEAIGPYVVDFVCREKRLIIEVDGGQHAESRRDGIRDAKLTAEGLLRAAILEFGCSAKSGRCVDGDS
jgi:very-short-patch-repair endonuclease